MASCGYMMAAGLGLLVGFSFFVGVLGGCHTGMSACLPPTCIFFLGCLCFWAMPVAAVVVLVAALDSGNAMSLTGYYLFPGLMVGQMVLAMCSFCVYMVFLDGWGSS